MGDRGWLGSIALLIGGVLLLLSLMGPWQTAARFGLVVVAAIALQPFIRRHWWTRW